MAAIVGATGPLLIQYLVDVADWLSGRLLRDFGVDVAKTLSSSAEWFATFGTAAPAAQRSRSCWALWRLLTILAALLVFLELLLRANAIYLIAALIPVIYAVRIWPAAKAVARHTTEVLLAVIFAQPVVALAISMGAAAGGAGGDRRCGGQGLRAGTRRRGVPAAGGHVPVGHAGPGAGVERAVAAHRQRAAVTGGARSGIQVAYTGTYLGRLAAAGRSPQQRRRRGGGGRRGGHRRGPPGAVAAVGVQAADRAGRAVGERQTQLAATATMVGRRRPARPVARGRQRTAWARGAPGQPGQAGGRAAWRAGPARAVGAAGPSGRPGGQGPGRGAAVRRGCATSSHHRSTSTCWVRSPPASW